MTAETQSPAQTSEPLDLQMLIETIPAMVVCALPDGSVEFTNRAWQEYTGGSLQQLKGSGWQTVIHPDDVSEASLKNGTQVCQPENPSRLKCACGAPMANIIGS